MTSAPSGDTPSELEGSLSRLGAHLSQARMAQGLSRDELAADLRMGSEQIRALEEGDMHGLPEMVFVIAQARRVAGRLGLEITSLVEPLRHRSLPSDSTTTPLDMPSSPKERTSAPRTWERQQPQRLSPRRGRPNAAPGRRPAAMATLLLVAGLGTGLTWGWQRLQPRFGSPAPTQLPGLGRVALPSLRLAGLERPGTQAPRPGQPLQPKPPGASSRPMAPTQMRLTSSGPSWLEVRTLNDTTLFKGTVQGEKRFPLGTGLKLLAGRPDLVTVQLGEGQPRPLGTIDQVRWQSFTPATPSHSVRPPSGSVRQPPAPQPRRPAGSSAPG